MKLRTTRKFKHKRKLMFNQTCSNCPLPPFLRIFDFALTVFEPLKILVSSFGTYARPAFPPALARAGRDLSCRGETPQGQKPYTSGAFASPPAGARAPRCSSSTVRECGLGRPKPIRGSEHSGRLARTLKFPNSVLPVMAVLPVTKSTGLCESARNSDTFEENLTGKIATCKTEFENPTSGRLRQPSAICRLASKADCKPPGDRPAPQFRQESPAQCSADSDCTHSLRPWCKRTPNHLQ